MKKFSLKKSLVASVLLLAICVTSLIGTTFAWFTDSVSSSGNKIVAGSLKIDLELHDKENDKWNSIKESQAPIFNYEYWEPGYVDAKLLKVENEGNLALKWKAKFVSDTALGILADAIDVYVKPSATELTYPASRDLIAEGYVRAGTIREFVNTIESTTYGVLEKKGDVAYLGIALKMQEGAGNDYQTEALGAFDIQIVATQLAYEGDSFGPDYDAGAEYEGEITNQVGLEAALSLGGNVKLTSNIEITEPVVVPKNSTAVLDLNGFDLIANNTTYVLNNHGNLTIMDSKADSSATFSLLSSSSRAMNARGIYNGYDPNGNHVTDAKLTIINGTYNATGENGGAAIFNYGIAEIKSGTFTSIGGYSLNNRAGATMIIDDAIVTGGIFNEGEMTINGGEIATTRGGYTHAVYHNGTNLVINGGNFSGNGNEVINANSSPATINGGTFDKVEKSSYLLAGSKLVVNGGNFLAFDEGGVNPEAHPVRPDVTINGGVFNYKHANVSSDKEVIYQGNGCYIVCNLNGDSITLADGAVLDNYGEKLANVSVKALGSLTIKGDTTIKSLSATNGGTITIEDGKTLTLGTFSFGAKDNADAEYVITGGTLNADHGFFQHGTYELRSDFETGYMYYSYGSDITVYGTFHSKGKGDGLDYVRGKLTIASGAKTIHDAALWIGQPATWGAMSATLVIEEGGYVQAKVLKVYAGSTMIIDAANIVDGVDISLKYDSKEITGTVQYRASTSAEIAAVVNGKTESNVVVLEAGEYTMPNTSSDVTIIGSTDAKLSLPFASVSASGNTITIKGVTVYGENNVNSYYSYLFDGAKKVVFENCEIYEQLTTYCDVDFVNCKFYNTYENDYSVYCYSGKEIKFDGCFFDTKCSKAIKLYDDGNGGRKVYVNDCTFTTETANKKAAIEIDSTFSPFYLYLTGNNVIKGAYTKLWNSDPGEDINAHVYINGDDVINTIKIGTKEELFAFANDVNVNGNSYSGKTVVLTANIDLENTEWTPIGQTGGNGAATYFQGSFDGMGYTISNLKISQNDQYVGGNYATGLFGFVDGGVANIRNLTVDGADVTGTHWTAVIVGYLTGKVENCKVYNASVVCNHVNGEACGDKAGVIVGYVQNFNTSTEVSAIRNCYVENSSVKAGRDAGVIVGCANSSTVANITDNTFDEATVTVSATGNCTNGSAGKNIKLEYIGRIS